MANFETKTVKDIYNGLVAQYTVLRNKYGDNTPLPEKSVIKSIFYAIAGVAGVLWQLSVWIYKQCFPQTCDLPALKFWGALINEKYKYGTPANLTVKISEVTAPYLLSGTIYKDLTTGLIFKTISQAAAENGTITANVICSKGGMVGNLTEGTILTITNPLEGIPTNAVVSSTAIAGTEDEKKEAYRKRVLYKYRNKAQSGSPLDYFNWVLQVSGIVDAFVYVLEEGTITIFPVAEGSGKKRTPSGTLTPNPFPVWKDGQFTELTGSGQLFDIANSIEGSSPGVHDRRPCKAIVDLKTSPNYTAFHIEITGLTDTSYNESIKKVLTNALDKKRPHIVVLNYDEANAKINKIQLSSEVSSVIKDETIKDFTLKDAAGNAIDETTLGIGCLAYMESLTINGESINLNE